MFHRRMKVSTRCYFRGAVLKGEGRLPPCRGLHEPERTFISRCTADGSWRKGTEDLEAVFHAPAAGQLQMRRGISR